MNHLFCIFDSAAGRYNDPFSAPSVEFAIREFRRIANKPDTQINRFPQDYTLFHIGEFDPDKGDLVGFPPRSLGVAVTFIDRNQLSLINDEDENGS